jgi:hypothetical protein
MWMMVVVAMSNMTCWADCVDVFHHCCPFFFVFPNDIFKDITVYHVKHLVRPVEFVFQVVVELWDSHCFPNPSFDMTCY